MAIYKDTKPARQFTPLPKKKMPIDAPRFMPLPGRTLRPLPLRSAPLPPTKPMKPKKKKKNLWEKAQGISKGAFDSVTGTIKDINEKHTPYGVGKALGGYLNDRRELKKSQQGLADVNQKAADMTTKKNKEKREGRARAQRMLKQLERMATPEARKALQRGETINPYLKILESRMNNR